MIKTKVMFEYYEGQKVPMWYVIDLKNSDIVWGDLTLYVPVNAPFEEFDPNDFHYDTINVSVFSHELLTNITKPNQFGLNVQSMVERVEILERDISEVDFFVIPMNDLEELLQYSVSNIQ
jgi:hypothetical protein